MCVALRQQPVPEFPDPEITWPNQPGDDQVVPSAAKVFTRRRFPLATSAAVLAVVLAVVVGGAMIPWSGSGSRIFAQVVDSVAKKKSVQFRLKTFSGDRETSSFLVSFVSPNLIRAEGTEQIHILDGSKSKMMSLILSQQKGVIRPIYDYASVSRRVMGPYQQLFELKMPADVEVTEEVIEGQKVLKFLMSFDGGNAVVLVDADTHLPFQMEIDRGEDSKGNPISDVIDQFVFDKVIDPAMFAIETPAGFVVDEMKAVPLKTSTESFVVSPDRGLGPAQFGMSTAEVIAIFGQPDSIVTTEATVVVVDDDGPNPVPDVSPGGNTRRVPANPRFKYDELQYDSRGFRLTVSSKDGLTRIQCFDALVVSPNSRKFLGKTPEGISIGSSWDEVLAVYGKPWISGEKKAASYNNPTRNFDFRDGKLVLMDLRAPVDSKKSLD